MSTKFFCTALFLFFISCLFGQTDSLELEILRHENKQVALLSNGRSFLLENFENNNFEKVKSLVHYLETEVEDDNYAAFFIYEKWLLYLWLGDYHKLFPVFRNLDEFSANQLYYNGKILPPQDLLGQALVNRTHEDYEQLIEKINTTNLAPAEKSFLRLFLKWQLFNFKSDKIKIEELNNGSNKYLNEFPDADFKYVVAMLINQELRLSKGGLSFEFFSGYSEYSKGLDDYFGNHGTFGVAFDYYREKWFFGLRDHIGIGNTDQDIERSGTVWKSGSRFNNIILELSAGRAFVDNDRWMIGPFAGVSFTGFDPVEKDTDDNQNLENVKLNFRPVATIGVTIDLKLGNPYTTNPMWRDGYGILRLRFGYLPTNFEKKYDGFDGNIFYCTLGIGGVVRPVVKKHKYLFPKIKNNRRPFY